MAHEIAATAILATNGFLQSAQMQTPLPSGTIADGVIDSDVTYVIHGIGDSHSGNGTIVLQTKVQNVLTGGIFVGLYSRDTKKLVMATTSDAGGTATFNNVSLELDKFFAVSLVDSVYNGLVIDRLEGV